MTPFALETAGLLLAAYVIGCAGGCWLRRSFMRRRSAR